MSKTKILVVDDHPMIREGIRELLMRHHDFDVVGEAGDGQEAVRLAGELLPDVVLMDLGMPVLSGLEATRQIKKKYPTIIVLVLTVHDEDEYILSLLEAGAAGYLLKRAYGRELVHTVRAVRGGEFVFHPSVGRTLIKLAAARQMPHMQRVDSTELTPREMDVLKLAATAMTNGEIADELGIGLRTVKGHLLNIFAKLEVGSRTEAVLLALKKRWITLDDIPLGD